MAVHLIIARCGPSAALAGDLHVLDSDAQRALLDRTPDVDEAALAVRLGERFAIGRREGGRASWWVVEPGFPLSPPHALWLDHGLFRPDGDGQVPEGVDMGALWETLTAGGDPALWCDRIASVVAALRTGDGPVALAVDAPQEALEAAAVLIAAILGDGLSMAVGHPDPDPALHRLSIGPVVERHPLLPEPPPGPGEDPVAHFVHQRLRSQPEQLLVPGGLTEDAVRRHLQAEALVVEDAAPSARIAAQVRAGAPVDDALAEALAAATVEQPDPAPWLALAERPEVERRRAVGALMRRADEVRPSRALVDAFMAVVPRGMRLAPLCATLLIWMRSAERPAVIGAHLEQALTAWPQEAGRANRASLWMEAVRILLQRGHEREAAEAATGPVATRMIAEGSSVAVALLWSTLPNTQRNPRRLVQLVEAMAKHPRGDRGAVTLLRLEPTAADRLFPTWATHRGRAALDPKDEVLRVALSTEHLESWLRAMRRVHAPRTLGDALSALLNDPSDRRWRHVFSSLIDADAPVDGLRLAAHLPADSALENDVRRLLRPALRELRFPDPDLAALAARYATLDPGLLWDWIGVTAAPPGALPDEVIDGTVVGICSTPPPVEDRPTCVAAAQALGAADGWIPLDHARWIVRLALAPQESGLAEDLLHALLQGLVGRFDAAPHLAAIVGEMFQLGPEHPALVGLLERWLPRAWHARMPSAFVEAVRMRGVPDDVRHLWERAIDADG